MLEISLFNLLLFVNLYTHVINYSIFFSSFFLDPSRIGKPRAQVATQLLMELNSDVKGDYIEETCIPWTCYCDVLPINLIFLLFYLR